jgi:hypothetical protein
MDTANVEPVDFKQTLQFLRENFALVSALTFAAGIALSILFLFSYLSVFDWHLLWLVQYPDVLSFGLVAFGVLGGSVLVLSPYLYMFFNAKRLGGRWLVGTGVFVALMLAWAIASAVTRHEGYFHIIAAALLVGGVLVLLHVVRSHLRSNIWPAAIRTMSLVILIVSVTFEGGRWLADIVLETNAFVENVQIKNQTLNDAKLVIVMSRFTVFLKDDVIHIYPTADVTELQTDHKLSLIP